jgi:DNA-binding transcriptional LysR family regulator
VPALVSLIEAGLGVRVVPGLAMPRQAHRSLVSAALVEPSITRMRGVIRQRGCGLSAAAQKFVQLPVKPRD